MIGRIGLSVFLVLMMPCASALASKMPVPTVPVPAIPPLGDDVDLNAKERAVFAEMSRAPVVPAPAPAGPKRKAHAPREGEITSYGVTVTTDMARAFDAYLKGDSRAALTALEKAGAAAGGNARAEFEISMLRTQVLIMVGRFDAAEKELLRAAKFEISVFGANVNSRALRGEARTWAGDYEAAIVDLARVAVATRAWRMPTSFTTMPADLGRLFNLTTAQLRAYGVLAAVHLLQEDFAAALPWAERAEARAADVFAVAEHPLYSLIVPLHADGYYGRATNLASLGAARLVVKKDRVTAEKMFEAARVLLDAIGFATPKVVVDAIHAQALMGGGFLNEAVVRAERAADAAARLGLPDIVWRVEALRGEVLFQDGKKAESEAAFRRAQAAIEAASGALATDRAKRRFGMGKDDVTYRLANFAIARGDVTTVFRDLERGRARAFVDMLADRAVATRREADLTDAIQKIDAALRRARLLAAAPRGASSADRKAQAALVARRRELTKQLRERVPDLADVVSIRHYELADIRKALGDGEVMAYGLPSRANDPVRLLLISRDKAEIRSLSAGHGKLRTLIRQLKSASFVAIRLLAAAIMARPSSPMIFRIASDWSWPPAAGDPPPPDFEVAAATRISVQWA